MSETRANLGASSLRIIRNRKPVALRIDTTPHRLDSEHLRAKVYNLPKRLTRPSRRMYGVMWVLASDYRLLHKQRPIDMLHIKSVALRMHNGALGAILPRGLAANFFENDASTSWGCGSVGPARHRAAPSLGNDASRGCVRYNHADAAA